ncbi:sensor histidine kinase [Massilia sp. SYSU DXS3249]
MDNAYRDAAPGYPDADELTLTARMRVVLAMATLLTAAIDPGEAAARHAWAMLILYAYAAQAILMLMLRKRWQPVQRTRLAHWLDMLWFGLLLASTGPLSGFFFLLFFPVATAALLWGHDEGARMTLAGAALLVLSALGLSGQADLANALLRTAFLIGLGLMMSHWGEALLNGKRRIALLRDVSRLSNPRFGVDHTISSVLEQTRRFFSAGTCLVLIRDGETGAWRLRSASATPAASQRGDCLLDEQLTAVLASVPARQCAVYTGALLACAPWTAGLQVREEGTGRWRHARDGHGSELADLLGARSIISAPVPLRRGEGRIFVASARRDLTREDAAFLAQVAAQAFPVIENIELLDRMASDAGRRERQKFSNDLHDTTLQPYIGLSHALQALARKSDDSPIAAELRQVAAMADNFVRDLRHFAQVVTAAAPPGEPVFQAALRSQAAEFKACYNLDIDLVGHDALDINDRLGAEVFQLVCEGMSNIRRHTDATRGAVHLRRSGGWLHIRIENECPSGPPPGFVPRSIAERAAALGGFAYVGGGDGATSVHVDIPV